MPLAVIARKGVKNLYIRGTHHGVEVYVSAGTADRREAEAIRETIERRIFEEAVLGRERARTFEEAADLYLRAGGEERFMIPVLRAFESHKLNQITQGDLVAAARAAYPGAQPSTLNRQFIGPFIAVYNAAAAEGWCPARPWKRIAVPEKPPRWLTPEEFERALGEAPEPMQRVMLLLAGSAMRIGEALQITDEHVAGARRIVIPGAISKTGFTRGIDVLSRAEPILRRNGRLLTSSKGALWSDHTPINNNLTRICRRAGISKFSVHALRHTGATWLYALTKDLLKVQAHGGWRSQSMVTHYVHLAGDDLSERLQQHGWSL